MKKKDILLCDKCGQKYVKGQRNKDKELPYEIKLNISSDQMKGLKSGHYLNLWWDIRGKRKLGYCEVTLEYKKLTTMGASKK